MPSSAKRPKAVTAWCLSDKAQRAVSACWCFDDRKPETVAAYAPINGYVFNPTYDHWIRVRIVPVPLKPRRRAARRKA